MNLIKPNIHSTTPTNTNKPHPHQPHLVSIKQQKKQIFSNHVGFGLYMRIANRNERNWKRILVSSSSLPVTSPSEGEILQSSNLKSFSYNELRAATRDFHPDSVLGEGGFGFVYKGLIDEHSLAATKPGTGIVVAVKKLNQEGFQGHREWLAEINYLAFLHSREPKVIYRDIKTSNISLDSNYNAKLADFGLARDGPTGDKSHVSTRVMGTHGYAAPEYLETGHLTPKSGVYSFGVVLLEMISGRRATDINKPVIRRAQPSRMG